MAACDIQNDPSVQTAAGVITAFRTTGVAGWTQEMDPRTGIRDGLKNVNLNIPSLDNIRAIHIAIDDADIESFYGTVTDFYIISVVNEGGVLNLTPVPYVEIPGKGWPTPAPFLVQNPGTAGSAESPLLVCGLTAPVGSVFTSSVPVTVGPTSYRDAVNGYTFNTKIHMPLDNADVFINAVQLSGIKAPPYDVSPTNTGEPVADGLALGFGREAQNRILSLLANYDGRNLTNHKPIIIVLESERALSYTDTEIDQQVALDLTFGKLRAHIVSINTDKLSGPFTESPIAFADNLVSRSLVQAGLAFAYPADHLKAAQSDELRETLIRDMTAAIPRRDESGSRINGIWSTERNGETGPFVGNLRIFNNRQVGRSDSDDRVYLNIYNREFITQSTPNKLTPRLLSFDRAEREEEQRRSSSSEQNEMNLNRMIDNMRAFSNSGEKYQETPGLIRIGVTWITPEDDVVLESIEASIDSQIIPLASMRTLSPVSFKRDGAVQSVSIVLKATSEQAMNQVIRRIKAQFKASPILPIYSVDLTAFVQPINKYGFIYELYGHDISGINLEIIAAKPLSNLVEQEMDRILDIYGRTPTFYVLKGLVGMTLPESSDSFEYRLTFEKSDMIGTRGTALKYFRTDEALRRYHRQQLNRGRSPFGDSANELRVVSRLLGLDGIDSTGIDLQGGTYGEEVRENVVPRNTTYMGYHRAVFGSTELFVPVISGNFQHQLRSLYNNTVDRQFPIVSNILGTTSGRTRGLVPDGTFLDRIYYRSRAIDAICDTVSLTQTDDAGIYRDFPTFNTEDLIYVEKTVLDAIPYQSTYQSKIDYWDLKVDPFDSQIFPNANGYRVNVTTRIAGDTYLGNGSYDEIYGHAMEAGHTSIFLNSYVDESLATGKKRIPVGGYNYFLGLSGGQTHIMSDAEFWTFTSSGMMIDWNSSPIQAKAFGRVPFRLQPYSEVNTLQGMSRIPAHNPNDNVLYRAASLLGKPTDHPDADRIRLINEWDSCTVGMTFDVIQLGGVLPAQNLDGRTYYIINVATNLDTNGSKIVTAHLYRTPDGSNAGEHLIAIITDLVQAAAVYRAFQAYQDNLKSFWNYLELELYRTGQLVDLPVGEEPKTELGEIISPAYPKPTSDNEEDISEFDVSVDLADCEPFIRYYESYLLEGELNAYESTGKKVSPLPTFNASDPSFILSYRQQTSELPEIVFQLLQNLQTLAFITTSNDSIASREDTARFVNEKLQEAVASGIISDDIFGEITERGSISTAELFKVLGIPIVDFLVAYLGVVKTEDRSRILSYIQSTVIPSGSNATIDRESQKISDAITQLLSGSGTIERQTTSLDIQQSQSTMAIPTTHAGMEIAQEVLNRATRFAADFDAAADEFGLDANYLRGVSYAESRFNPRAVSRNPTTGAPVAYGIIQIIPATANGINDSYFHIENFTPQMLIDNPALAIRFGAYYISRVIMPFTDDNGTEYRNNIVAVAAAYNMGPAGVRRYIRSRAGGRVENLTIDHIPVQLGENGDRPRAYVENVLNAYAMLGGQQQTSNTTVTVDVTALNTSSRETVFRQFFSDLRVREGEGNDTNTGTVLSNFLITRLMSPLYRYTITPVIVGTESLPLDECVDGVSPSNSTSLKLPAIDGNSQLAEDLTQLSRFTRSVFDGITQEIFNPRTIYGHISLESGPGKMFEEYNKSYTVENIVITSTGDNISSTFLTGAMDPIHEIMGGETAIVTVRLNVADRRTLYGLCSAVIPYTEIDTLFGMVEYASNMLGTRKTRGTTRGVDRQILRRVREVVTARDFLAKVNLDGKADFQGFEEPVRVINSFINCHGYSTFVIERLNVSSIRAGVGAFNVDLVLRWTDTSAKMNESLVLQRNGIDPGVAASILEQVYNVTDWYGINGGQTQDINDRRRFHREYNSDSLKQTEQFLKTNNTKPLLKVEDLQNNNGLRILERTELADLGLRMVATDLHMIYALAYVRSYVHMKNDPDVRQSLVNVSAGTVPPAEDIERIQAAFQGIFGRRSVAEDRFLDSLESVVDRGGETVGYNYSFGEGDSFLGLGAGLGANIGVFMAGDAIAKRTFERAAGQSVAKKIAGQLTRGVASGLGMVFGDAVGRSITDFSVDVEQEPYAAGITTNTLTNSTSFYLPYLLHITAPAYLAFISELQTMNRSRRALVLGAMVKNALDVVNLRQEDGVSYDIGQTLVEQDSVVQDANTTGILGSVEAALRTTDFVIFENTRGITFTNNTDQIKSGFLPATHKLTLIFSASGADVDPAQFPHVQYLEQLRTSGAAGFLDTLKMRSTLMSYDTYKISATRGFQSIIDAISVVGNQLSSVSELIDAISVNLGIPNMEFELLDTLLQSFNPDDPSAGVENTNRLRAVLLNAGILDPNQLDSAPVLYRRIRDYFSVRTNSKIVSSLSSFSSPTGEGFSEGDLMQYYGSQLIRMYAGFIGGTEFTIQTNGDITSSTGGARNEYVTFGGVLETNADSVDNVPYPVKMQQEMSATFGTYFDDALSDFLDNPLQMIEAAILGMIRRISAALTTLAVFLGIDQLLDWVFGEAEKRFLTMFSPVRIGMVLINNVAATLSPADVLFIVQFVNRKYRQISNDPSRESFIVPTTLINLVQDYQNRLQSQVGDAFGDITIPQINVGGRKLSLDPFFYIHHHDTLTQRMMNDLQAGSELIEMFKDYKPINPAMLFREREDLRQGIEQVLATLKNLLVQRIDLANRQGRLILERGVDLDIVNLLRSQLSTISALLRGRSVEESTSARLSELVTSAQDITLDQGALIDEVGATSSLAGISGQLLGMIRSRIEEIRLEAVSANDDLSRFRREALSELSNRLTQLNQTFGIFIEEARNFVRYRSTLGYYSELRQFLNKDYGAYGRIGTRITNGQIQRMIRNLAKDDYGTGPAGAFPTFKVYFVEEDTNEWIMYDDVYSYNSIVEIVVRQDRKDAHLAAATLKVTNFYNKLTNVVAGRYNYEHPLMVPSDNVERVNATMLRKGTPIVIMMSDRPQIGFEDTVFTGRIEAIDGQEMLTITCISDGDILTNPLRTDASSRKLVRMIGSQDIIEELINMNNYSTYEAILRTILSYIPPGRLGDTAFISSDFRELEQGTSDVKALQGLSARLESHIIKQIEDVIINRVSDIVFNGRLNLQRFERSTENIRISEDIHRTSLESFVYQMVGITEGWVVENDSSWDVISEILLQVPNHIAMVKPYDIRSTLVVGNFLGGYYKFTDRNGVTNSTASGIISQLQPIVSNEESCVDYVKELLRTATPKDRQLLGLMLIEIYSRLMANTRNLSGQRFEQIHGVKFAGGATDEQFFDDLNSTVLELIEEIPQLDQQLSIIEDVESQNNIESMISVFNSLSAQDFSPKLNHSAIRKYLQEYVEKQGGGVESNSTTTESKGFISGLLDATNVPLPQELLAQTQGGGDDDPEHARTIREYQTLFTGKAGQDEVTTATLDEFISTTLFRMSAQTLVKTMLMSAYEASTQHRRISETWIATSDHNIIVNNIQHAGGFNEVTLMYPTRVGSSIGIDGGDIEQVTIPLNRNILPDRLYNYQTFLKNVRSIKDIANTPQNVAAVSILANLSRDFYGGELVLRGNQRISIWDTVVVTDHVRDMFGVLGVKAFTHVMNRAVGFRTLIEPDLISVSEMKLDKGFLELFDSIWDAVGNVALWVLGGLIGARLLTGGARAAFVRSGGDKRFASLLRWSVEPGRRMLRTAMDKFGSLVTGGRRGYFWRRIRRASSAGDAANAGLLQGMISKIFLRGLSFGKVPRDLFLALKRSIVRSELISKSIAGPILKWHIFAHAPQLSTSFGSISKTLKDRLRELGRYTDDELIQLDRVIDDTLKQIDDLAKHPTTSIFQRFNRVRQKFFDTLKGKSAGNSNYDNISSEDQIVRQIDDDIDDAFTQSLNEGSSGLRDELLSRLRANWPSSAQKLIPGSSQNASALQSASTVDSLVAGIEDRFLTAVADDARRALIMSDRSITNDFLRQIEGLAGSRVLQAQEAILKQRYRSTILTNAGQKYGILKRKAFTPADGQVEQLADETIKQLEQLRLIGDTTMRSIETMSYAEAKRLFGFSQGRVRSAIGQDVSQRAGVVTPEQWASAATAGDRVHLVISAEMRRFNVSQLVDDVATKRLYTSFSGLKKPIWWAVGLVSADMIWEQIYNWIQLENTIDSAAASISFGILTEKGEPFISNVDGIVKDDVGMNLRGNGLFGRLTSRLEYAAAQRIDEIRMASIEAMQQTHRINPNFLSNEFNDISATIGSETGRGL